VNDAQRAALQAAMQLGYPAFPCGENKKPTAVQAGSLRHLVRDRPIGATLH
jgi:hypothetical protein